MAKYFFPADILLPKKDFEKWSVIACDQYTSEPEYWAETQKIAENFPSALNIVLPEVYLQKDNSERINKINENMKKYIENGVFDTVENSYVLTLRTLKDGKLRQGVVGLIDLEDYSYESGADTLIRATEQTVLERIPPRVEIRRDATLEIPHVMLLIDDKNRTVIEPLTAKKENFEKIYDFSLMQNAGSIEGYKISEDAAVEMGKALEKLAGETAGGLLFAVGDGNHSLATAKECYKQGKGSRYALVEVVNIHDASLEFEPIYRALFGVNPQNLLSEFVESMGGEYEGSDAHTYECIYGGKEIKISVKAKAELAVADLQIFLDDYIGRNPEVKIDYIHGIENTKKLCQNADTLGFIFDGMGKDDLFPAVAADGSLPRKTFSMGCADDKRFYLEARKI